MTKLSFWTKVWYGYGNIGNAVKTVVFSTFLFFYYNQLLGLSGKMCGTALLIALCFDAINDPLIGFWSDKMDSKKWGKRLPFMIFGGLPFAISLFFLLFRPQGYHKSACFFGLFVFFLVYLFCLFFVSLRSCGRCSSGRRRSKRNTLFLVNSVLPE